MTLWRRVQMKLCRHHWSSPWEPGVHPSWVDAADGDETMLGLALLGQDVWVFSEIPIEQQVLHRECLKCGDIQHLPATAELERASAEMTRLTD